MISVKHCLNKLLWRLFEKMHDLSRDSMPDCTRDSVLFKLKKYCRIKTKNRQRSYSDSHVDKLKSQATIWDYETNSIVRHTFKPGKIDSPLKGRCSMLKVVVKKDINSSHSNLTIFGRTDLVCQNSEMVTHANWRRDLSVPFRIMPNEVRCYAQNGCVIVDLNISP